MCAWNKAPVALQKKEDHRGDPLFFAYSTTGMEALAFSSSSSEGV
jgi:hypothetical protein